jgi:hypothetical protein
MLITMRTTYAGPRGNGRPGDVLNLPDEEAQQLIDGGYAFRAGREVWPAKVPRETAAVQINAETATAAPVAPVSPAPAPKARKGK